MTEKERMWLNGGPGVYSCDYRKYYDLATDDWKFDRIPEIMDGKNVADYVDADIDARLEALEREEDQLEVRTLFGVSLLQAVELCEVFFFLFFSSV
jgi:nucleolar GTP-binding protein